MIENAATCFGSRLSNSLSENLIREKNSVFIWNKRLPVYGNYFSIYYSYFVTN